jgi:hypothetical protein
MSPERQSARRKAAPPAGAVLDEIGGGAVRVSAHAKSGELVIADDTPNILAPEAVHKSLCDLGHAVLLRCRHIGTVSAPKLQRQEFRGKGEKPKPLRMKACGYSSQQLESRGNRFRQT